MFIPRLLGSCRRLGFAFSTMRRRMEATARRERAKGALDARARRGHMGAMPRHDPVPPRRSQADYERAASAWARYKAMMKWMALAAFVSVLLALIYLKSSGEPVPIHMAIATVAGVGFSVLLGTALMGLVFLSNNSGHDDAANGDLDDRRR
jgi:hypothetical protein